LSKTLSTKSGEVLTLQRVISTQSATGYPWLAKPIG
jgi:hypothetical protein